MSLTKRIIGYDIMRIIAATMVVCIHSNVYFLCQPTKDAHWLAVMIMTAACVVSVPLFFMVSGAGNLPKDTITSTSDLFKKKIPRVFIPFLIWSLIYVGLRIATGKLDAGVDAFVSLLHEPAYYQFWFMYTLLGLYLCIPVFQYLVIKCDKKLLQYIIVLWAVTSLLFPLAQRYVPWFKLSEHFNLIFLKGYWGYFFIGGYLRKYPVANARRRGLWLALAGAVITFGSALIEWHMTPADQYRGYVYRAYMLPGAAMMTTGIFLYFQHLDVSAQKSRIIVYLSGLTMGIYYVHCLLINAYETVFRNQPPTVFNAVVKVVVVVAAATCICAVLKKIKPLNKYLL